MKLRVILLAGLLLSGIANAQAPFENGEKLDYVISYRARLVPNSEVADVTLSVSSARLDGVSTWQLTGKGRTKSFFRWFFDLNDTYQTWLESSTLRPLKATVNIREGSYRYERTILFDWQAMQANSTWRNLKRPDSSTATMSLTSKSFDALALFYNLRAMPREGFVAGQRRTMQLVLEDEVHTIGYTFLGREERNVKDMGRFRTMKFSCQLVNSQGEQFEEGSEFFIWLSDDSNMIPLYIESPIRVGSIQGTLRKYNNLKFPLDSRIVR